MYFELLRYAKEGATPVFLIGHITKDGMIAGPKILEHMVDTVLQFEGDRHHVYRIRKLWKIVLDPQRNSGFMKCRRFKGKWAIHPKYLSPNAKKHSAVWL